MASSHEQRIKRKLERQQEIAERFGYKNIKEFLVAEYKIKTAKNIANMVGMSEAGIFHWIRECNIPTKIIPKKYAHVSNEQVIELKAQGKTYNQISQELGITHSVICQVVRGMRKVSIPEEKLVQKKHNRKCRVCGLKCWPNWLTCKTCQARMTKEVETAKGFDRAYCCL